MLFADIYVLGVKFLEEVWANFHLSTSQQNPLSSQTLQFELVSTLTPCQRLVLNKHCRTRLVIVPVLPAEVLILKFVVQTDL